MIDNVIPIVIEPDGKYRVSLPMVPNPEGVMALPTISTHSREQAEIIRAGIVRLMDQATIAALTGEPGTGTPFDTFVGADFSDEFIADVAWTNKRTGILYGVVGTLVVIGLIRLLM